MNVESISGRNLSGAFRIANLVVAGLSVCIIMTDFKSSLKGRN